MVRVLICSTHDVEGELTRAGSVEWIGDVTCLQSVVGISFYILATYVDRPDNLLNCIFESCLISWCAKRICIKMTSSSSMPSFVDVPRLELGRWATQQVVAVA